jgi:hypothetical protein
MTGSNWVHSGLVALATTLSAATSMGCSQVEGSACNPALSHDECDNAPTIQCIWPTNAACFGQAYCCKATPNFDGNGTFLGTYVINSTDPNCASLAACQNGTGGETSTPTPEASMPEASSSEASMKETGTD